jgi:hypothetical protein
LPSDLGKQPILHRGLRRKTLQKVC